MRVKVYWLRILLINYKYNFFGIMGNVRSDAGGG
jgi:hypothetical protein